MINKNKHIQNKEELPTKFDFFPILSSIISSNSFYFAFYPKKSAVLITISQSTILSIMDLVKNMKKLEKKLRNSRIFKIKKAQF